MMIVRLLVAGSVAAGSVLATAQGAQADSWHTHTSGAKKENQPGYSKQAAMSSAKGAAEGGGGWDATTKVWIENENGDVLASSKGPGWQWINVTIPRKNAVYAGCKWTSASYSGSGTILMDCEYYGGAPINGRRGVASPAVPRDSRVARLARSVALDALGAGGLRVASLRFVGRLDGITYFRGLDDSGQSCLLGWSPRHGVAGSACAPRKRIARHGPLSLRLGVQGKEHSRVVVRGNRVHAS